MFRLLIFLLYLKLLPPALLAQLPQEGKLRYLVEMRYNEEAPRAGLVIAQAFEVAFDSAYIKTSMVDSRPVNFNIYERATDKRRSFSDFYGYCFEFMDSINPSAQLGDFSITYTGKTKQILGVKCERILIDFHKYKRELQAYVAPDFPINYPLFLKGCAFEFSIPTTRGLRVYQLSEMQWKELPDSIFHPQGYRKIYSSELPEAVKGNWYLYIS